MKKKKKDFFCYYLFLYRRVLELEEEYIKGICDDIIKFKPDLLITEKGISGKSLSVLLINR